MLRFRFKISTEAGQVRVGHIEAVTVDVARRILESKKFTVLELDEAKPAVRRARAAYPPHPIEYLEKLESAPSRRNAILGSLAALGLLLAVWHGARPSGRGAPVVATPVVQSVQLVITGQVSVPSELRPRASLRFSMPELPLTLVRDYQGLVGESGEYRLEYDFQGPKAPGEFSAELRIDGRPVDRTGRLPFIGQRRLGQAPPLRANP